MHDFNMHDFNMHDFSMYDFNVYDFSMYITASEVARFSSNSVDAVTRNALAKQSRN